MTLLAVVGGIMWSTATVSCLIMLAALVRVSAQDMKPDVRHGVFERTDSRRFDVAFVEERLAPFYHGIASGDPLPDKVIIWTRVTPRNGDRNIDVRWVVALDTGLTQVVRQGAARSEMDHDFTVKVDVSGLQPGTVYYYAFEAYGTVSLIGRTKTMPATGGDHARFAVVSCSNYPAGYFNAYACIAQRNDLDAVLHLGDYIYEYAADSTSYAGGTGKQLGRMHSPEHEIVTLADYRARYNQYRLDPDLRALHQQHPIIHVWDDHESANDSYTDGAENHQPDEGDWKVRRELSKRACYEWMPTRENVDSTLYRSFVCGSLVDISMLDTRLDGRDKQINDVGDNASPESKAALNDTSRHMMSNAQYDWLVRSLGSSNATWHILGNQVLFSAVDVTPIDTTYMFNAVGPVYSAFIRPQVPLLQQVFEQAFYADVWSNYPAQRARLCNELRERSIKNVVITTGDFHCSFALDVATPWQSAGTNVAIECVTPSVTSPNFDENLSTQAFLKPILNPLLETIDTTLRAQNPHLLWHDIVHHGYQIIDVVPERVQCDWFFVDSILIRSNKEHWARGYWTPSGSSSLRSATSTAIEKAVKDIPAPPDPPATHLSVRDGLRPAPSMVILSYGPMPAQRTFSITYATIGAGETRVMLTSSNGQVIRDYTVASVGGIATLAIDVEDVASGNYTVTMVHNNAKQGLPIIVKK